MPRDYDDFDLEIGREGQTYVSRVSVTGMGDARNPFPSPFRDGELDRIIARLGSAPRDIAPTADGRRAIQEIGERLFSAVFDGSVGSFWTACLRRAREADKGLRLHLRLRCPELWDWPWEYLCDPDADFLALLHDVSIVRYLEIPQPTQCLRVNPPLRVLVAVARPRRCRPLDSEREWELVRSAWETIASPGCVELELLAGASTTKVRQALRRPFHIFHFIGHGELDGARRKGVLLFEKGKGEGDPVTGKELIRVLRRQLALRLVVLNACEGARAVRDDPFAGVAQQLVQGQIPAVVAMQFRVADDAAITFSRHFYQSLAQGMPVDAAVSEARLELAGQHFEVEWGNPVLCMRSLDGQIFTVPPVPERFATETSEPRPPVNRIRRWLIAAGLAALVLGIGAMMLIERDQPHIQRDQPHIERPASAVPVPISDTDCPSPPGLDMSFVKIEPGTFVMGSDKGLKDQRPAHSVTISKPFCLGRFEVTEEQWERIMGRPRIHSKGADLPIANVSWEDAQAFLAALNRLDPEGRYRLPTEAEWEYAARAGTEGRHSFGSDPDALSDYANCRSEAKYDGYEGIAPVGSFPKNRWGLYDMYGNVSEWVADWYGPYRATAVTDPTGPATGMKKVRRGGSFTYKVHCDSIDRRNSAPGTRGEGYGFRVRSERRDLDVKQGRLFED